jgi:hypothetical protein
MSNSSGGTVNAGTNTADKTSATLIVSARSSRDELIIGNTGAANNLYVGNSGVTTATGYKLVPGAFLPISESSAAVYVIADNATSSVSWYEVY